jgi:hypothetical protein
MDASGPLDRLRLLLASAAQLAAEHRHVRTQLARAPGAARRARAALEAPAAGAAAGAAEEAAQEVKELIKGGRRGSAAAVC